MYKLFLDLSDKVTFAITKSNYLITFGDLDYNDSILNTLYNSFNGLDITEANIILHGNLCTGSDYESAITVHGLRVEESVNDIQSLQHLCEALNCKTCRFIEYVSYLNEIVNDKTLLVETLSTENRIYVFSDRLLGFIAVSDIEDTIKHTMNQYNLAEVYQANRVINKNLLNYYANIMEIPSDEFMRSKLAMFAFMVTNESDKLIISVNKLQASNVPKNKTSVNDVPDLTNNANTSTSTKPVTDKPKKKKGLGIKFPKSLKTFLFLLIPLLFVISFGANKYVLAQVNSLNQVNTSLVADSIEQTKRAQVSDTETNAKISKALIALSACNAQSDFSLSVTGNNKEMSCILSIKKGKDFKAIRKAMLKTKLPLTQNSNLKEFMYKIK